jgi:hypothetical protein
MPYATVADLAVALNIAVTPANQTVLYDCLDAAATEIDHHLRLEGIIDADMPPSLIKRTNINRAVEWYKAPDTFNGGVGYVEVGQLQAPQSGFERHAAVLLPFKTSWGIA